MIIKWSNRKPGRGAKLDEVTHKRNVTTTRTALAGRSPTGSEKPRVLQMIKFLHTAPRVCQGAGKKWSALVLSTSETDHQVSPDRKQRFHSMEKNRFAKGFFSCHFDPLGTFRKTFLPPLLADEAEKGQVI